MSIRDLVAVAAEVVAMLVTERIPREWWGPLLRSEDSGEDAQVARDLGQRIAEGTQSAEFALTYTRELVARAKLRYCCNDAPGSADMLKLLLESCPPNVSPRTKAHYITRVISAYQAEFPCCRTTPCTRPT